MTEQQLLDALAQADADYQQAQKKMAKAKMAWMNTETVVIEAKLKVDDLREKLRVFRKSTPNYVRDLRTQEIEDFRERNPEIVEFIFQRDKIKENQ